MASTRNAQGSEDDALIEEACDRNAPIELQYESSDGELLVARTRLLGFDETHVYLDRPQSIGDDVRFRRGQRVEGYMLLHDVRYAFATVVEDLATLVEINATKRTVGMVLRRPATVRESQRRSHFRVAVLSEGPITAAVHAADPGHPGACPIDAGRAEATLLNLSAGGAGLLMERGQGGWISAGDHLFMTFQLPEEEEPICFLVDVRQCTMGADSSTRRVGVRIRAWPTPRSVERTRERLQRYITAVQRKRLRRAG